MGHGSIRERDMGHGSWDRELWRALPLLRLSGAETSFKRGSGIRNTGVTHIRLFYTAYGNDPLTLLRFSFSIRDTGMGLVALLLYGIRG